MSWENLFFDLRDHAYDRDFHSASEWQDALTRKAEGYGFDLGLVEARVREAIGAGDEGKLGEPLASREAGELEARFQAAAEREERQ